LCSGLVMMSSAVFSQSVVKNKNKCVSKMHIRQTRGVQLQLCATPWPRLRVTIPLLIIWLIQEAQLSQRDRATLRVI